MPSLKIGVLALQGGFQEHVKILSALKTEAIEVRLPFQLKGLDGLILPGGESTTFSLLMRKFGFLPALKEAHAQGLPLFGTCAGAIVLSKKVGQKKGLLGLLDISIERNAYGRQVESFEASFPVKGLHRPVSASFIRAPIIRSVGKKAEVLATFEKNPVLVRQGNILAATFHAELVGEKKVHALFLGMCRG